ncbi:MAG: hypothetical protein KAR45_07945 [Desulfobacteraceae bacterium]|nr:hypothetical protein [Desulfobacteraceae bacterium]
MATGKRNKLTGQIGEHLVAAMLGTMGYYASPYAGNVPGFDLTAVNADTLKSVPVQVKTSTGGAVLQSSIDKWVEFHIDDQDRQHLGNPLKLDHSDMIWVLVSVRDNDLATARFFVCTHKDIQKIVINNYKNFLDKHNGRRPRNPNSKHAGINIQNIERFENNWQLFD